MRMMSGYGWTGNRIGCDVRSCTGVRCFRQLQLRVKVREKKEERWDKTGQEMMRGKRYRLRCVDIVIRGPPREAHRYVYIAI